MAGINNGPQQGADGGAKAPLVEVGIPTLGGRKYVHEAIASVQAQTYGNWRLIVSVNAIEPAQDFSAYADDERIEIQYRRDAMTSYGNKNAIIRATTAPYLALLDDDDRWEPGFLERRVEVLEDNPGCAFVFSTFTEFNEAGVEIGPGPEPFAPAGIQSSATMLRELLGHPSQRLIQTTMLTTLVRRSALQEVGPAFDESLPVIADYELWLRLASRFPVVFLHSWDAAYRRHTLQDSHGKRLEQEFLEVFDRLDSMLEGDLAPLRPDPKTIERQRARWLLSLALEFGGRGERRSAASLLASVGALSVRYLFDRRLPVILATLVLGSAMAPVISTLRSYLDRRSIRPRRR
jgi:glycosyltransferase involved in cell wall biosynthesis